MLATLVIAKIAVNEWNYRAATQEALVAAYGPLAVDACQHDARSRGFPPSQARARPGEVALVIGSSGLDGWFWDVTNSSWAKRYRTPYLKMELQSGHATLQCAFDVNQKTAVVSR